MLSMPPPLGGVRRHGILRLEAELRGQHDHASGDDGALSRPVGAGGRGERGGRGAERTRRDGSRRDSEVRMVQDVEELASDFKCVLLLNEELLGKVRIDIEVAGAAENARSGLDRKSV